MEKVKAETPWGDIEIEPSPHGSPRIIEVAKTHPAFIGMGLRETAKGTWECMVFIFSSQSGIDEFKEYLKQRGEEKQKFFEIEYEVKSSWRKVTGIVKWLEQKR